MSRVGKFFRRFENRVKLFKKLRCRGFSLVELLISIVIVLIAGGVVVAAFHFVIQSFSQTDDYSIARTEIEFVFRELRPQITNIGLGMPNSKKSGTQSFRQALGGLLTGLGITSMDAPLAVVNGSSELIYAWGVETGVRLGSAKHTINAANQPVSLEISADSINRLQDFTYKGMSVGLDNNYSAGNIRAWLLFPSLRIPLRVTGISGTTVNTAAPPVAFEGNLRGYDEVHALLIARLFVSEGRLMQQIYGQGTNILANHIDSVHFAFDPNTRVLTMSIAAHGGVPAGPAVAPRNAPDGMVIPSSQDRRVLVEKMSWRIKN